MHVKKQNKKQQNVLPIFTSTFSVGGKQSNKNEAMAKINSKTRMVRLPATAAIEYMSPLGTFSPRVFWPGGFLSGGAFVWGAYARSPQVQCVCTPSRLSVPIIVACRTNKQKNRQTQPRSSTGSRPPLPKFSGYVEVEAHYIFHRSTI